VEDIEQVLVEHFGRDGGPVPPKRHGREGGREEVRIP